MKIFRKQYNNIHFSKPLKKEHLQGTTEYICLIGGQEWKSNLLKEIKSFS